MYNYSVGALPAVIAGIVVACLMFVRLLKGGHRLSRMVTAGIACAVFSSAYSLLGPLLQVRLVTKTTILLEIANGHLALRVMSLVATLSYALLIRRTLAEPAYQSPGGADPAGAVRAWVAEEERQTSWPLEALVNKVSVLMLALAALWVVAIDGTVSLASAALNWVTAFILDDLVMAANYRYEAGVPPPRFDRIKINLGTWLALALFIVVMFERFDVRVAWAASLLGLWLVLVRPILNRTGTWFEAFLATWGILDYDDDVQRAEEIQASQDQHMEALSLLHKSGIMNHNEYQRKARMVRATFAPLE